MQLDDIVNHIIAGTLPRYGIGQRGKCPICSKKFTVPLRTNKNVTQVTCGDVNCRGALYSITARTKSRLAKGDFEQKAGDAEVAVNSRDANDEYMTKNYIRVPDVGPWTAHYDGVPRSADFMAGF